MIFEETYDYLFNELVGSANVSTRSRDYQRKRLSRALLARSVRPYLLEASWINVAATVGEANIASTQGVTNPLIVLDGAIRTSAPAAIGGVTAQQGSQADRNSFELQLFRTAGNSRVQLMERFIKDEHLLTPAQAAIRPYIFNGRLGQGAPYPLTWPVPMRLMPNELIQVKSQVLSGAGTLLPAGSSTFCQFRAVMTDNKTEDDALIADLQTQIAMQPRRPIILQMYSDNAKSITFPATGLLQRTTAKTREADSHLLVLGYAALFARSAGLIATGMSELGTTCSPKWRLHSSNGHAFSKEEVDIACYGYASPGSFWTEFPNAFLLPKGSSLSASFSTLDAIADATEQRDNYVLFRCVTV